MVKELSSMCFINVSPWQQERYIYESFGDEWYIMWKTVHCYSAGLFKQYESSAIFHNYSLTTQFMSIVKVDVLYHCVLWSNKYLIILLELEQNEERIMIIDDYLHLVI